MYSGTKVTIGESKKTNILERFDFVINKDNRSKSILKLLSFFIDYDPNYIRTILQLAPLTPEELKTLHEMKIPKLQAPHDSATIDSMQEETILPPGIAPQTS